MLVHICKGGYIRKYPSLVCSLCRPGEHINLNLYEYQVDWYNEFWNKSKEKDDKKELSL